MLVLATLGWAVSFPTVKALLLLEARLVPGAGAWFATLTALAPRFCLGALGLGAWHWRLWRSLTRREWEQGVSIGFFAGAGMIWQTDGLHFTAASTSAFLTQFYALLIPVYVAWRTRSPLGWRMGGAAVLVLAGVAILGRFDVRTFRLGRGELETLVSSLFFMGQILWLEKKAYAANRPAAITLVTFLVMGLVFGGAAVAASPSGTFWLPWTSPAWVGLTLLITAVSTILAYSLMNAFQPRIPASEAGLIYGVEPVFGSLLALFLPGIFSAWAGIAYPNERATATLLLGGALITIANVLVQLRPPPRAPAAAGASHGAAPGPG